MTNINSMQDFQQALQDLRKGGGSITKAYLDFTRQQLKPLSRMAPALWRAIMSRRYILPESLQGVYVNQEACDYLLLDFLVSYSAGLLQFGTDDVTNVAYMDTIRALQYDRPTYFMEYQLGEALLRTDPPLDLSMEDINWIYPQLRIYLPSDLLSIERNGNLNPAMYMSICRVTKGEIYTLPPAVRADLERCGGRFFPDWEIPQDAFLVVTHLHFDCDESNINYAVTVPWESETLRTILEKGSHDLRAGIPNDDLDRAFQSKVICFAVNVLLWLSSMPIYVERHLKREKVIRPPRTEGKHQLAGLYPAKLIGDLEPVSPAVAALRASSGRHLTAHWRRGLWRRQPYGPKSSLRKMIWVAPCHIGTHES